MELEELTQELWQAAEKKRSCRIQLVSEPLTRNINPYGICLTPANHIVLVCWQFMGFTKPGGKEGYRNLQLTKIEKVELMDLHFQKRDDFNSADSQYKDWVFHI